MAKPKFNPAIAAAAGELKLTRRCGKGMRVVSAEIWTGDDGMGYLVIHSIDNSDNGGQQYVSKYKHVAGVAVKEYDEPTGGVSYKVL